jgi:AraC-like DNA-binding protein
MSALMTTDSRTFAQMNGLLAGNAVISCTRADVLTPRSVHFDDICAELRSYSSTQENEFEVGDDAHIMLMRCDGTSSRCEILWLDDEHRQVLPELKPGSILFCPAANRARIRKKDKGRCTDILLRIPPSALDLLNDVQLDSGRVRYTRQAGCGRAELCHILFAMRDEILFPGPAGRLYRETLALQLVIQLLRHPSELAIAPPAAKGGLSAHQLRRAVELLEADLTRTPSLHQLAAHVGLSPTHFCTAFKRSAGHPPHRYLLNRRVAYAKSLLTQSRLTLTEIALRSGFASSSHFASVFRRITGTTPSAYRRCL